MRAVVLGEVPWSLRVVDDWPEPSAGSGQVVVRVRGVGICGSDLALLSGHWRPPSLPWVPGHEAFGEIVERRPRRRPRPGRAAGDHRAELPVPRLPGVPVRAHLGLPATGVSLGFNAPGMLAERIAVPAEFAWPVPAAGATRTRCAPEPLTVALAAIRRSGIAAVGLPGAWSSGPARRAPALRRPWSPAGSRRT